MLRNRTVNFNDLFLAGVKRDLQVRTNNVREHLFIYTLYFIFLGHSNLECNDALGRNIQRDRQRM